MTELQNTA